MEKQDLTITTATVEIKTVRIGRSKMTKAVFNQLPCYWPSLELQGEKNKVFGFILDNSTKWILYEHTDGFLAKYPLGACSKKRQILYLLDKIDSLLSKKASKYSLNGDIYIGSTSGSLLTSPPHKYVLYKDIKGYNAPSYMNIDEFEEFNCRAFILDNHDSEHYPEYKQKYQKAASELNKIQRILMTRIPNAELIDGKLEAFEAITEDQNNQLYIAI